MSGIRDYPKGTFATVETDLRDIGADGYVVPGAWVRLHLPDSTGLYYQQHEIELVQRTSEKKEKKKVRTPE